MTEQENAAPQKMVKLYGIITRKELATIYELSPKSLAYKLKPIAGKLNRLAMKTVYSKWNKSKRIECRGRVRVLNPKQLKLIVETLGNPPAYTFDGTKFTPDK